MKAIFTTYFDKNYLQRGLTLIRSLFRHQPDAEITVLCLDKISHVLLAQLALPRVTLLQLDAFEKLHPELLAVKGTRTVAEYCWTLTPCLLLHLLAAQKEGDGVIYLDADQMFFSSPKPVVTELRHSSVLIQAHNFPERLRATHLQYGKYNVGVLGARNNTDGIQVIAWWKERCLEWCSATLDDAGRFGDQKYLESFSSLSQHVAVIKHPGVGIAPWNHENAPCGRNARNERMYGKVPVVIYHFHSLVFISYDLVVPVNDDSAYQLSREAIEGYYTPYLEEIDASLDILRGIDTDFSFGTRIRAIPQNAPFIVRTSALQTTDHVPTHTRHALSDRFTLFMPAARGTSVSRRNAWEGNYPSWEEACRHAGTYGTEEILRKTLHASRLVRDGKAVCERDSVLLPERQYLLPTLSGILLGAARNGNELHLVDFGGALGSTYRTHYPFLRHLKTIRWHVVELPAMVQAGRQEFQNGELFFHDSIEACRERHRVDGILLGATLQYLEDPYAFLYQLGRSAAYDFLILDRTSFHAGSGGKICVQHVPASIYSGSYPCHLLDFAKTAALVSEFFDLVDVMPSREGTLDEIAFRGLVAVAKSSGDARQSVAPEPKQLFQHRLAAYRDNPTLPRYVNLGCGSRYLPDWLNMDFAPAPPHVFGWNLRNGIPLPDDFADAVYHSNLIEHFTRHDALDFLRECLRVLKPGGILRVAAPDLEEIARSYLRCLDGAKDGDMSSAERYEWSVIELLDQLVRHTSGGEMLRYWARPDMPAEDYVLRRVGTEFSKARQNILKRPPKAAGQTPGPLQVGNFRLGGEVHQWMYDAYSLSRLLCEAGATDLAQRAYADSDIPGFAASSLEKNSDGGVYKPDSFYVEGKKQHK